MGTNTKTRDRVDRQHRGAHACAPARPSPGSRGGGGDAMGIGRGTQRVGGACRDWSRSYKKSQGVVRRIVDAIGGMRAPPKKNATVSGGVAVASWL